MPGPLPHSPHSRHSPAAGRLAFLDGLRGLAALYVVLHHAALEVTGASSSRVVETGRGLLRHGHFAVAVFIVLSGYCLMRPVAGDPAGRLRGGLRSYLGRRARRILPPYYAALGLCWLLIALVPGLDRPGHVRWDRALPAFEPGVVVSHLMLIHNLDERWIFKVDPPLWSVATEWQIYLIFPALLALWRRQGMAVTVAAAFAVGGAVAALAGVTGHRALTQLCPWYAGLFALGMAGAVTGRHPAGVGGKPGRPSTLAVLLGFLAMVLAGLAAGRGADAPVIVADLLVGAAATRLIRGCARQAGAGAGGGWAAVRWVLESRPAAGLGSVSYSLYLIHFPILALFGRQALCGSGGVEARLGMMLIVAPAFCVLAACMFRRVFERPAPAATINGWSARRRALT
jgi:peptidoglycan/LPS O-acetylase OafA/YrhL